MLENAEHLFVQNDLGNAVMVIKACESAPAQMERRIDVCLAPLHYIDQFGPVIDIFKRELLNGSACYDHAVEVFLLYLGESLVELYEMLSRGVLRMMCLCKYKLDIDLDR